MTPPPNCVLLWYALAREDNSCNNIMLTQRTGKIGNFSLFTKEVQGPDYTTQEATCKGTLALKNSNGHWLTIKTVRLPAKTTDPS